MDIFWLRIKATEDSKQPARPGVPGAGDNQEPGKNAEAV